MVEEDAPVADRMVSLLAGLTPARDRMEDVSAEGVQGLATGAAEYTAGWRPANADSIGAPDPERCFEMGQGWMQSGVYAPRAHGHGSTASKRRPFFVGFRCARTANLP